MTGRPVLVAIAAVGLTGCLPIGRFECDQSDGAGPRPCDEGGQCLDGSCAYPSDECASGWRFSPSAERAEECTVCGGSGQPCCVNATACEAGQFCAEGTCDCFYFVEVEAGREHVCARDMRGDIRCWGRNDLGETGSPDKPIVDSPPIVVPVGGVIEISAGERFTCARDANGVVRCWGGNTYGELGNGNGGGVEGDTHEPVDVVDLTDVQDIDAGGQHACAIVRGGQVYCWGWNIDSQVGQSDATESYETPVAVALPTEAVELALGARHSCARDVAGDVWCWGLNFELELGVAAAGAENPVAQPSLIGEDAIAIVAGAYHTCAGATDGTIWCWGKGDYGQLGDGDPTPMDTGNVPVAVSGLAGRPVAAGENHTCATDSTNALFCWGNGDSGQLGDDATITQTTPVAVTGVGTVRSRSSLDVAAGGDSTCAITDGNLDCWGANGSGQLLADLDQLTLPERVPLSCP